MTDAFTRQGRNRLNINQKGRNPRGCDLFFIRSKISYVNCTCSLTPASTTQRNKHRSELNLTTV